MQADAWSNPKLVKHCEVFLLPGTTDGHNTAEVNRQNFRLDRSSSKRGFFHDCYGKLPFLASHLVVSITLTSEVLGFGCQHEQLIPLSVLRSRLTR